MIDRSYATGSLLTLRSLLVVAIVLLVVFPTPHGHSTTLSTTRPPVNLIVFDEDLSSSNITDPTAGHGTVFNMSIQATNLPTVFSQGSSGISGFDIALGYNSSVLRIAHAWSGGPECSKADNCIFDLPVNDTVSIDQSIDNPPGLSRIGMLVLGPSHLPDLSNLSGQPAILFRAEFVVVGTGRSPINVLDSSSQITGLDSGCGSLISFTATNANFDNRFPFAIQATPTAASVRPGNGVIASVNVSRVNDLGNGNVTLELGNAVNGITGRFTPRTNVLNSTHPSFVSSLLVSTRLTTPPGTYNLVVIGVLANYPQLNINFTLTVSTSAALAPPPPASETRIVDLPLTNNSPPPSSLIASFTADSSPAVSNPVVFTAIALWCSETPYSLHWDFGDGSVGTGNPSSHTYTAAGAFTVTLSVTDSGGNSYSSVQRFDVTGSTNQSGFYPYVLPSAIVLVILVVAGLLLLTRRRTRR